MVGNVVKLSAQLWPAQGHEDKVGIPTDILIPNFPKQSSVRQWEFDSDDSAVKEHDKMAEVLTKDLGKWSETVKVDDGFIPCIFTVALNVIFSFTILLHGVGNDPLDLTFSNLRSFNSDLANSGQISAALRGIHIVGSTRLKLTKSWEHSMGIEAKCLVFMQFGRFGKCTVCDNLKKSLQEAGSEREREEIRKTRSAHIPLQKRTHAQQSGACATPPPTTGQRRLSSGVRGIAPPTLAREQVAARSTAPSQGQLEELPLLK
ncbi:Hypp9495 [Branchiostoma lanceolatum]|uniref:Hypp9495 protein n=1 Tax=Branchiostoma lanceolatum TaxID=7740 RepID=A0A8S4MMX5_BRALA|nr:Hypp9495 [Branchiostoma lanceolatum]